MKLLNGGSQRKTLHLIKTKKRKNKPRKKGAAKQQSFDKTIKDTRTESRQDSVKETRFNQQN